MVYYVPQKRLIGYIFVAICSEHGELAERVHEKDIITVCFNHEFEHLTKDLELK